MVNPIVKKHFLKYGLPATVLQSISNLVMGSLDENATEEEIIDSAKTYDDFAKSFQSEVDSKIAKARKEQSVEEGNGSGGKAGSESGNEGEDETKTLIKQLLQKVSNLEADKINKSFTEKATYRLKSLKMTDAEINATLYGRKFSSDEELEDFVAKQEEFYSDILKTRTEQVIGNGGRPPVSQGSNSKEALKQEIESFNERY